VTGPTTTALAADNFYRESSALLNPEFFLDYAFVLGVTIDQLVNEDRLARRVEESSTVCVVSA
jgi:hypothetical protein